MDLAHSVGHGDIHVVHPCASTQKAKQAALASLVRFLIGEASLAHSTASAPSSQSRVFLSAYESLAKSSELETLDVASLEGIISGLIEHQLVGYHLLNAISLCHFHRMVQRKEGENWSSQGREKVQKST